MLAIRLPPEIETRLERLAAATGRTKTFYAREAIVEYLGDLEDIYLAEQVRQGDFGHRPTAGVGRKLTNRSLRDCER